MEEFKPRVGDILKVMIKRPLTWINICGIIGIFLITVFINSTFSGYVGASLAVGCFCISLYFMYGSSKSTLIIADYDRQIANLCKSIGDEK